MQGLGNDFIFLDGIRRKFSLNRKTIRALCDRRFGIGADQLLVLGRSRRADFAMEIFNADGGAVSMCGNGIRALAKYVREEGLTKRKELTVETPAGVQRVRYDSPNRITVDMGRPILKGREIPVKLGGRIINRSIRVNGVEHRVTCLSMGNPHAVLFVEDLNTIQIEKIGPEIENHNLFPKRINVEFVKVISREEVSMRVWERGAGETLACGSGACAAVVASCLNHLTDRKVTVRLKGGTLKIDWREKDNHLHMTGPAETVFKGEVEI